MELRRFLGAVEWLRRFIPNLAKTEKALVDAGAMPKEIKEENDLRRSQNRPLRDDWKLALNSSAVESFEATKRAVMETLLLSTFKEDGNEWETCVALDAGGGALGGVLMQRHRVKPGITQVVACYSRKMTSAELNYIPTEQELLAIYACVKHWEDYCEGRCVTIFSDHQPLEYMNRQVTQHSRGRITCTNSVRT
jgi:hypothetical protein